MDVSSVVLIALSVAGFIVAYVRDPALPARALVASGNLFGTVWFDLALGFLLGGLITVLIPQPALSRWLGTQHLGRGILAGSLAGLLLPGGPYVFFPVAANLLDRGAAPGPIIALLTAKTLVSPIRMLTYEAPLLGWPMTLARFVPGVLAAPLLGYAGQWIFDHLTRLQSVWTVPR